MTAIAYRDGVIAADTDCYFGAVRLWRAHKILKREDGTLAGASGRADHCEAFLKACAEQSSGPAHFELPDATKDEDGFTGILITPKREIWVYSDGAAGPHKIEAPFLAIGMGDEFMMGAMAHGATAEEAVTLATQFVAYCGGKVIVKNNDPIAL